MYVADRLGWIRRVFHIRGSVLPIVWPRIAFVTVVATVFTAAYLKTYFFHVSLTTAPFVLVGVPLGIFLGFRNNVAYDRFWEGRKLWGQLVNTSRAFTRQVLTLTTAPAEFTMELDEFRRTIVRRHAAYVHSLRLSLRAESYTELTRFLPDEEVHHLRAEPSAPNAILHQTGVLISAAWKRGWIDSVLMRSFDQSLVTLADVQGGCERIKSTPIPFSYTVLIHRIVAIYCLLLPFGLVETARWTTPFVVLIISNALFGLDAIGDEIENPFGHDVNDLPLHQLATMIESNVLVRIGDKLPEPIRPKNHILS